MRQSLNEIRNAYDRAAEEYAKRFLDELTHKPRDVELLQRFASAVGPGRQVLDLGCGPGHTTAHLASLGVRPTGVDLSPEMIRNARSRFPGTSFRTGDLLHLADQNESVAGVLAFYCIVHLQANQLVGAFREMLRVLESGGVQKGQASIGQAQYCCPFGFLFILPKLRRPLFRNCRNNRFNFGVVPDRCKRGSPKFLSPIWQ